jgi:hypothetical protein
MGANAAWAAVAVSAGAVIASIFGVLAAGRTQRRLAHLERIGDRRIETYLELLKWLDTAEADLKKDPGWLGAFEAMKLPDDLRIRIFAFASDRTITLTRKYQNAWLNAYNAVKRDEGSMWERLRIALTEGDSERTFFEKLRDANVVLPEFEQAVMVSSQLRGAVREELTRDRRSLLKSIKARFSPPPGQEPV